MAYQRLYSLEKRFVKDPDLKAQYAECLDTYFQEGHISPLDNADMNRPGYFLTHQAVIKKDSLTTKTRVVFDGSARTSSGISLNDTLLIGPTIQEDLFSIVLRFRSNKIAFTADIKQMYRQILVSKEDTFFQKILWRKNTSEPIKAYWLNTVTFGTSCAPFLATRTLHQLANDEQESFPLAAEILKRDVYVDDFLSGAQNLQEASKLRDQLIHLLQRGGFSLRKWASNCPEFCRELSERLSEDYLSLDPTETVKALGVHWDPLSDSILYTVNLSDGDGPITKRSILSQCSKLFDPLGLVGPVILIGKILIQSLWKIKLGWDDIVPLDIQENWVEYRTKLPLLSKVRFSRWLYTENSKEMELHGFCDASEKAYGACVYVRTTDTQNNHHCVLICSKSRVAPIKISNSRIKDSKARQCGKLSLGELIAARNMIIKQIQLENFPNELSALQNNKVIDKKSCLLSLNPFLKDGILRVGGRINKSALPESQKHPIILPKNHQVTRMITRDVHVNKFHSGINATLYGVRENYWPLDRRNTVRHIIKNCIPCVRAKPLDFDYIMGNLPEKRVNFTRAFEHVGVDYWGPFFVKEHRHRNRTKVKTYVAIFVCLATKAVHLELASDMTTESFISALKRFFARRGVASSMHSDNGKNFVGASREIKELYRDVYLFENDDKTQQYLLKKEVKWHFIPPRAPHFGGLWEAGVKAFKYHFVRVVGNSLLTYEQLQTYVVEIESILNSRPLTPLSSDPNDLLPLTPGHFLTGSALTCLPQTDLRTVPANRLNCWQLAQQLRHHFWDRWHKEYLNEVTTRSKWKNDTDQTSVTVGRLVLVKEDNLPPMMWKLARIIEVHPGQDGVIRAVTIRTAKGTFNRALRKLCPLPLD